MEIVLGVSMAPETVCMVLVEGVGAGGVTVDQDDFEVTGSAPAVAAADRVIAAILGTRESAAQGGYQLLSSGVTWTDQVEATALRDALAARKIENVMLVSAFMAAAALAQAVGSATNCARTALLFVEPASATLAVVDSSDGSIVDVYRQPLPEGDDAALAQLTAMVAGAESMKVRPDGVFLVGSGVDIPSIKPTLEAATSLSVTAPEEPEMALARGAALASANAQLGAPSTVAMPYVGPGSLAESARGSWPTAPLRNTRTASTANPAPIWANGAAASRCWRSSLRWRSSSVRRLPWRLPWHSISGRTWTSGRISARTSSRRQRRHRRNLRCLPRLRPRRSPPRKPRHPRRRRLRCPRSRIRPRSPGTTITTGFTATSSGASSAFKE